MIRYNIRDADNNGKDNLRYYYNFHYVDLYFKTHDFEIIIL